jgi:small subunit ribosomal protein S20
MPNSLSAKKRVRQNLKQRALNNWRENRVKFAVKAYRETLHTGDLEKAQGQLTALYKLLDQIASTNTIHKNTASRYKSRLTLSLNTAKAAKTAAPAA